MSPALADAVGISLVAAAFTMLLCVERAGLRNIAYARSPRSRLYLVTMIALGGLVGMSWGAV